MDEELAELAAAVHARLVTRESTVASAESLTGGELAAWLTRTPGASGSFIGGVVTYATALKESLLDVPEPLVATYGVVSAECALAMAAGVRRLTGAGWGVSTTGVAGPDQQEGKAVGTVYVGFHGPAGADVAELALRGGRRSIREATCAAALAGMLERLS